MRRAISVVVTPLRSGSDANDLAAVCAAVCAPCVLPVAVLASAFVLDVAMFPIQIGFGLYPYCDRDEPGRPMRR